METLFLYLHILCTLFFFFREILLLAAPPAIITLWLIIYLSLIVLPVITRSGKMKLLLHSLLLAGLVAATGFLPQVLLLLPLHIPRILALITLPAALEILIFLFPVWIFEAEARFYYLFFIILAFLLYKTLAKREKAAHDREQRIDLLEHENQCLVKKLNRLQELDQEQEFFLRLEERNRITQKLHDELGHTITGSIVQLQAVQTILKEEPAQAAEMVAKVTAVLNHGMNSIRQELKSLKPATGELGLQNIKHLLADFEKNSSLHTRISVQGNPAAVPAVLWRTIIINLQEALTNVLKHSQASEVHFELLILNALIKAGLRDNGRGKIRITPGMGLAGMHERTGEAGGTLILDGSNGFSVIMLFKRHRTTTE